MRKLIINNPELLKSAIREEIHRSDEARFHHRIHAILLASHGLSSIKIGNLFGESPRTIQYWIKRSETNGLRSLRDGRRTGRHQKLSTGKLRRLERDIKRSPRKFKYTEYYWDGKLLSIHIKKNYKIRLCVQICNQLFKTLGYECRNSGHSLQRASKYQNIGKKRKKCSDCHILCKNRKKERWEIKLKI
jgi:transposase